MLEIAEWPEAKLRAVLGSLGWVPLPWQVPPAKPGNWWAWFLIGGRWSGKTELGSHYVDEHATGESCLDGETPHRIGIIGPTKDSAGAVCVVGETGLLSQNREIRYAPGGKIADLVWPNGAVADLFGAYTPEDPERLRGPAHCLVWGDEVAAWRRLKDTWDNMRLGLRLGPSPRFVGGTTPKPRKFLRELLDDPLIVATHARTADNPYAPESVKQQFYDRYGGTRLGRQELEGEFLWDVPGALWEYEWIEAARVVSAPELSLSVVAVDPAVSHAEESDETGIGAAAKGIDGHYYILDDRSVRMSPDGWAKRTLNLLDDVGGVIIAEDNQGGEMVETTIRQYRRDAPVKRVRAMQSKEIRAQPVAALYEQGKVHHVGMFPELEDQMVTFPVANERDDRVDWLVHALTYLSRSDRTSGWGAA